MSKQGAEKFGAFLDDFLRQNKARFTDARAFAVEAGVSEAAVSRWRRGVDRPSADALSKIAPLVGVRVRDLFALAYPEYDNDEDTHPLPVPDNVPPAIRKSTLLTDAQQKLVAGIIDELLAANESRPSRRRRASGDTTRTGDDRKAI